MKFLLEIIVQHSTRTIKSKPSVVDNGTEIYYVGSDLKLYGLFYSANTKTYSEELIDDETNLSQCCHL
jgi:hypothetical protein